MQLAVETLHVASSRSWGLEAHVVRQLVRSVTSAGANYEEARHAESRADFVHKLAIAAKEMAESLYWFRLLTRMNIHHDMPRMSREADELVAILMASIKTARKSV